MDFHLNAYIKFQILVTNVYLVPIIIEKKVYEKVHRYLISVK